MQSFRKILNATYGCTQKIILFSIVLQVMFHKKNKLDDGGKIIEAIEENFLFFINIAKTYPDIVHLEMYLLLSITLLTLTLTYLVTLPITKLPILKHEE